MSTAPYSKELGKPIAGLIFLVCWAIAIVAWVLMGNFSDHATRGFVADVGIVFASIGFSALFVTRSGLMTALWLGLVGVVLFAVGGYLDITVLVYLLRLLGPTLALLAPLYKISNGFRLFN